MIETPSVTSLLEGELDVESVLGQLDLADCEDSLLKFIELSWSILEPTRPFVPNWHIEAICDHLTAVSDGEINRLLISVPPGCMKSLTTDVFWPAWLWGPQDRPDLRFVSASYAEALTVRDNRRCRNIIQSDWYQRLWGDRFFLVEDQNAKVRYENNHRGFKIATSVEGLGTGERGDIFTVDDPHNVQEGESQAKRLGAINWFKEVVPTRVNDPISSAIVVIMQRIHEHDVSGVILEEGLGYEHLMLPMRFEPDRRCTTSLGFTDPREDEGELIWPERMPLETVERDEKVLGPYATAAQHQQRPAPRGGGMFREDWFEIVEAAPAKAKRVRGWDLASTEKQNSPYTAGVLMSRTSDGIYYIEHVVRCRRSPDKVERALKNTASLDGPKVTIDIPQDPGQAGKSQVRYFTSILAGYVVRSSPETGDKELRAEGLSAQASVGNVKLVRGSWNRPFLDEVTVFPRSKFKDQTDAASRAFAFLVPKGRGQRLGGSPVEVKYAR